MIRMSFVIKGNLKEICRIKCFKLYFYTSNRDHDCFNCKYLKKCEEQNDIEYPINNNEV